MGKRIEDLRTLDDTPIGGGEHRVEAPDPTDIDDLRDQPWYQFIGTIDDLTESGRYDWAVESLNGIRETVERTRRVTEGQRRAVGNIEARGESRRYEGYGGFGRRWR